MGNKLCPKVILEGARLTFETEQELMSELIAKSMLPNLTLDISDKNIPALPLAIFHDHFSGQPGGIVIFYVENDSGTGCPALANVPGRLAGGNPAPDLLAQPIRV